MEDPDDKSFRIRQLIIFSFLMVGVLASIIALYSIGKPFIEDAGYFNLVLIVAIVIFTITYVMAIKTGIPPSPPKTKRKVDSGGKSPNVPKPPVNPPKQGGPPLQPKAAVKSGIPPSPRKTNG